MPADRHVQLKTKQETGEVVDGATGIQAGASIRSPEIAREEGKGGSSQTDQSILHSQDKTPWKEDTQHNLGFNHSSNTISQYCYSCSDHGSSLETAEIEMHSDWTEDWLSRQTEQNWWLRSQLKDWAKTDVAGNMDMSGYHAFVSEVNSGTCADGSACSTRSARPDSAIGAIIDIVSVGSWA